MTVKSKIVQGGLVSDGFTSFGVGNIAIKIKQLTATLGVENSNTSIAHGLDASKIIGYVHKVTTASGVGVDGAYGIIASTYKYNAYHTSTNFVVYVPTGSSDVASKTISILVFYIE